MPRLSILTSSRPAVHDGRARLSDRPSRLRSLLGCPPRGVGLVLSLALFGATGYYGAQLGGQWPIIVARYGTPGEIIANLAGLRIETVTITGQRELTDTEILTAAGVKGTTSLPFLDAEASRDSLQGLPLVKSATVHKLFPDTLAITIEERKPFALWQKDGTVSVIAADGTPIEVMHDARFANLPFVVGDGAGVAAAQILTVLDRVPSIKARVRACVLIAGRRWNLNLDNGVVVRLPEDQPERALAALARLETDSKVIDKDILAIDMRLPDRVAFRLGADASAARAEAEAKKPKKGAHA